jgi:mevalonate kinase
MGVSHPSLEQVRAITSKHGLKTKLTGAGGGGCAVTVIRDGKLRKCMLGQDNLKTCSKTNPILNVDTQHETIEATVKELTAAGFECYETSVGGPGVGVSIIQDDQWNATSLCKATRCELESVSGWRWM